MLILFIQKHFLIYGTYKNYFIISLPFEDEISGLTDDGYNPLFPNCGSQKELEFL